jgi:hypothetical protein
MQASLSIFEEFKKGDFMEIPPISNAALAINPSYHSIGGSRMVVQEDF